LNQLGLDIVLNAAQFKFLTATGVRVGGWNF